MQDRINFYPLTLNEFFMDDAITAGSPDRAGFFRQLAEKRGMRVESLDIKKEVGLAAGEVYAFLEKNGETSLKDLRAAMEHKGPLFMAGIGWLLREDKLDIRMDRGVKIRLK
jgi:hypothetical protein